MRVADYITVVIDHAGKATVHMIKTSEKKAIDAGYDEVARLSGLGEVLVAKVVTVLYPEDEVKEETNVA